MFEPASEACLRARFSARSQAGRPLHPITVPREVVGDIFCAIAGDGSVDFDAEDFLVFPPLVQVTTACALASDIDDSAINQALTMAWQSPVRTHPLGALVAVRASALDLSRFSEVSRALSSSLHDSAAFFQSAMPSKALPAGFVWITICTIHSAPAFNQQQAVQP